MKPENLPEDLQKRMGRTKPGEMMQISKEEVSLLMSEDETDVGVILEKAEKIQQEALALSLRQVEALESIAKSLDNLNENGISCFDMTPGP